MQGPGDFLFRFFAELPKKLRRITTEGSYRPEIDGLRFFAIAIVVVGHFIQRVVRFQGAAGSGFDATSLIEPGMGVFLFFTISGFIIASQSLKKNLNPLSKKYLAPYFLRRVTRIEPPYFVILVVTYLLIEFSHVTPPGVQRFWLKPTSLTESLVASIFYSHGWIYGTLPRLFAPGWTLELEVQFYIIAPIFFYFYYYKSDIAHRILLGCAGLVISTTVAVFLGSVNEPHINHTILRFLPYFWLGLVLADVNNRYAHYFQAVPAAFLSAAGWIAIPCYLLLAGLNLAISMPLELVCIAVMFAATFGAGSFRAFCGLPWISLIGGACYSIYLTHLQILQLATFVLHKFLMVHLSASWFVALFGYTAIEIPAVIAVGLAFYALVERPFMTKNWPSKVTASIREMFRMSQKLAAPADTKLLTTALPDKETSQ